MRANIKELDIQSRDNKSGRQLKDNKSKTRDRSINQRKTTRITCMKGNN